MEDGRWDGWGIDDEGNKEESCARNTGKRQTQKSEQTAEAKRRGWWCGGGCGGGVVEVEEDGGKAFWVVTLRRGTDQGSSGWAGARAGKSMPARQGQERAQQAYLGIPRHVGTAPAAQSELAAWEVGKVQSPPCLFSELSSKAGSSSVAVAFAFCLFATCS